jgi:hypothetical protein
MPKPPSATAWSVCLDLGECVVRPKCHRVWHGTLLASQKHVFGRTRWKCVLVAPVPIGATLATRRRRPLGRRRHALAFARHQRPSEAL